MPKGTPAISRGHWTEAELRTLRTLYPDTPTRSIAAALVVYAAMQQFGGQKSDFPHLWGNIPARPFLGASEADKVNIADLVRSYMLGE